MAGEQDLNRFSTKELLRELERRRAMAGEYEARRAGLAEELARIDAEIAALEGSRTSFHAVARHVNRSAAARTRSANHQPLNAVLQKLLMGRTMSVTEAAEAVQRTGYQSNAANFQKIVNLTLLKRKDLFKRVGRGQYTAK